MASADQSSLNSEAGNSPRKNYSGWTNFLDESKHYMGYGTRACPRWRFWLGFPGAAVRFYWYCFKDWAGPRIKSLGYRHETRL